MSGRCQGPGCAARGSWGFKLPKAAPDERSRWYCRAHKDLGEAWLAARTGKADRPAEAPPLSPPKQARFL